MDDRPANPVARAHRVLTPARQPIPILCCTSLRASPRSAIVVTRPPRAELRDDGPVGASNGDFVEDLAFALRLVDLATSVALPLFGEPVPTETKGDGTPVTAADFAVEAALVALVRQERPADGVLSEEGAIRPARGRRWIFDPIDGTVNFAAADPNWGTHVALEVEGEIVVGVIAHPVAKRRWWAWAGGGAFTAKEHQPAAQLRTSSVDTLADARITLWPPEPSPLLDALQAAGVYVEPDWTLMAEFLHGELDAIVTTGGGIWDHAPCVILTEQAGGCFRDHRGGRRLDRGGGIYSNGAIGPSLESLLTP